MQNRQSHNQGEAWAKSKDEYGGPLTLEDHARDISAVVTVMLQHDRLREKCFQEISDHDVSRLAFLAGLHDAGKASNQFRAELNTRNEEERGTPADDPRLDHLQCLWAILGRDPRDLGQTPRCCYDVYDILMPKRRIRWFARRKVGIACDYWTSCKCWAARNYWGALLAHHGDLWKGWYHRQFARPAVLAPPRQEPSEALWQDTPVYSPRAALKRLVSAMKSAHPDAGREAEVGLPSDIRFINKFARFVQFADQYSSKTCYFPRGSGTKTGAERFSWAKQQTTTFLREQWDEGLANVDIACLNSDATFDECLRGFRASAR